MSSCALTLVSHQQRGIRFDDCASFFRFFLPLVPSMVEQFMMSRNIDVTVSILERRVLGGKLNSQRDLRAHKNGRGRSRLS